MPHLISFLCIVLVMPLLFAAPPSLRQELEQKGLGILSVSSGGIWLKPYRGRERSRPLPSAMPQENPAEHMLSPLRAFVGDPSAPQLLITGGLPPEFALTDTALDPISSYSCDLQVLAIPALLPDGKGIAVLGRSSTSGRAGVWLVTKGNCELAAPSPAPTSYRREILDHTAEGDRVVSASLGVVRQCSLATGRCDDLFPGDRARLSPDKSLVAYRSPEGVLKVRDLAPPHSVRFASRQPMLESPPMWCPDSRIVLVGEGKLGELTPLRAYRWHDGAHLEIEAHQYKATTGSICVYDWRRHAAVLRLR